MPQYGSNGINSDGSMMNVGNHIWDPSRGGKPSIRLHKDKSAMAASVAPWLRYDEEPAHRASPQETTTRKEVLQDYYGIGHRVLPDRHEARPLGGEVEAGYGIGNRILPDRHGEQHAAHSALHSDLDRLRTEEAAVVLRNYFNTADVKAVFDQCDRNGDKSLDAEEAISLSHRSMNHCVLPNLPRRYDTLEPHLLGR